MAAREMDTPLGRMRAEEEGGALTSLRFVADGQAMADGDDIPLFARLQTQLAEYFAGTRTAFDIPLRPRGTPFMQMVWEKLRAIPCGQTQSYGAIAASLGMPRAARAVGGAIARNPIMLLIPCHRVCAAGGIGGYAGGVERKKALLDAEQRAARR